MRKDAVLTALAAETGLRELVVESARIRCI